MPAWTVELGIGVRRQPIRVHAGSCRMVGSRRRAVSREEAWRARAAGVEGCAQCSADAVLGWIDGA